MIVERVVFHIEPGREEEFAEAVARAREVFSHADGFLGLRLLARGVESPSDFLLLAEWESVEAHTEGFRGSELFTRWREAVGPYFAAEPPEIEHYVPVDLG
ncbi:MAG TPA: antibiotic biosynthesis monooxygenase [Solirubrobacteraceae bacterium]|jgi:heme-degrading monooxygenase HmoA|nr:antibiotic biosynthesis monooxygenase [Solirubrobacteraceae bacterium]